MERGAVVELVDVVHAARARTGAGREELVAASATLARLQAWVDASAADLAGRLARCTSLPEADLVTATRTGRRDADRVIERAGVLDQAPEFADSLNEAKVTAGHVDALGRTLRSLEPEQRQTLLDRAGQLAEVAEVATVEDFARHLGREARRLAAEDGMAKLERQRRDSRLRTWVDRTSGMWHIAGRFDPETGLRLAGRLDNTIAALFTDTTPQTCPSDPGEKQDHLRALALVALTDGKGARSARPEITVVVDTTGTDDTTGGPLVDWGLSVELPYEALAELWKTADVHTVVVRNGVVIRAPGNLNQGRTARVANRAQRRALRALYKTCGVVTCDVPYRYCKLHHIDWWDHHGLTDLDNLFPLCERHHHAIHDLGWQIHLGPHRELTLDLPDGTRYTTSPPQRGRETVTKTLTTTITATARRARASPARDPV